MHCDVIARDKGPATRVRLRNTWELRNHFKAKTSWCERGFRPVRTLLRLVNLQNKLAKYSMTNSTRGFTHVGQVDITES